MICCFDKGWAGSPISAFVSIFVYQLNYPYLNPYSELVGRKPKIDSVQVEWAGLTGSYWLKPEIDMGWSEVAIFYFFIFFFLQNSLIIIFNQLTQWEFSVIASMFVHTFYSDYCSKLHTLYVPIACFSPTVYKTSHKLSECFLGSTCYSTNQPHNSELIHYFFLLVHSVWDCCKLELFRFQHQYWKCCKYFG